MPDLFTLFDQLCPGRRLKKELRLGTQEDVWREITSLRDAVFDIVSHGAPRRTAGTRRGHEDDGADVCCPAGISYIGDFLAFQYVTDLNYSTLTSFSETEFVVPGSGALSGLRKCFADTGRLTDAEIIRLVQERQAECFAAAGVTFPVLPGRPLQLIDVQNLFCEVDKYARAAYPQLAGTDSHSRIKQRFQPSATLPPLWYPPEWGINDRLDILSCGMTT